MKYLGIPLAAVLVLSLVPLSNAQIDTVIATTPLETMIAQKINDYRRDNGYDTLSYDDKIADIARGHSEDMKRHDVFQHETPGTVTNSIFRGAINGYGLCGSTDALDRYHNTVSLLTEYNKTQKEYEKNVQLLNNFYQNDQGLANRVEMDRRYLDETYDQLVIDVPKVNDDIVNYRIGVGFVENLYLIEILERDTVGNLSDLILQGWIDSPDHNEVLFSHVHSLGVGITQNDRDQLLVTLNMC